MIREIVIRRFKRFGEEQRFDLRGHVVLAGQNNCGKTTVLQAISAWALALAEWRKLNDFGKHHGGYAWAPISRPAFTAVPLRSFDLLWNDRRYEGKIEISLTAEKGWTVVMEFAGDSTEQIYVRPRNGVDADVLRKANLEIVYVSPVGGLSVMEPVYQPDYIQNVLGMQKPGDVIRNLILQVAQGNRWEELNETIRKLFGVELVMPQTPGGQIVCEYRRGEGEPSFDLLCAGTGFQQVVMVLCCLYAREGSVLLVDEPDAHLHVFLQDTIFSVLQSAAAKSGSQLIMATHSEVIFNSAPPEQLCVMMGAPRRLTEQADRERLSQAMGILRQSDIVTALEAPGILYLENYTDLNLLREWARKLDHPVRDYFERSPFWQPTVWESREGGAGIKARDHFEALKLVRSDLTGVQLIDADGKRRGIEPSPEIRRTELNRIVWKRYETESYLLHPAALARFIDGVTGAGGGTGIVRQFFEAQLTPDAAKAFIENPFNPPPVVENYFQATKAREKILPPLLTMAGIHGMDYTRFHEIAAGMEPQEIHPEVRDKLDSIKKAFAL